MPARLDLSWNSEDGIIYFGDVAMEAQQIMSASHRMKVTGEIFRQLVSMQNELIDLRRWKQHTDEWIKSRPADVDRSKP